MSFGLGFWAAAGAGAGETNSFELISTTSLTGGAAASITFSSIPSTYKHLQIRFTGRSTLAAGVDNLSYTFNADSASNYSSHSLYGDGGGVYSNAFTSNASMYLPSQFAANSTTANAFSAGVMDILDYASTSKNKTVRVLQGYMGSSGLVSLVSNNWRSSSAVTSVTFTTSANIAQYSRFSLYGIKG